MLGDKGYARLRVYPLPPFLIAMNGFGTIAYTERRTETLHVRVTPSERRTLEALAFSERRDLSTMVRVILERAWGTITSQG